MKRTALKRKTPLRAKTWLNRGKTTLKRSPLRKKGKSPISKLKRKLWTVFSKYIKERDDYICFTCGRKAEGSGMHAGHFISKSVGGMLLYFHEDNVHAQCYNCNINLSGNQYIYGQKLGEEKVAELYKIKNQCLVLTPKEKIAWYEEKIEHYTTKI